ncbi:uncharacterized protein LOC132301279 isoform X2 [Cornus florida]|uniref:uncharacterized protein LOC132301279 isoform X2 n=1 Tax=Cornus florida TaxID=4283 RepID=UPI0028985D05|nr:uncharacterized protein LOC132301279 isoform X2 [Cornus florida]
MVADWWRIRDLHSGGCSVGIRLNKHGNKGLLALSRNIMKRRATINLELELHGGLSQGSNSQSHTSHGSQEEDVGTTESNELRPPKKTQGSTRCANVVQHDTKKNGLIPLSVNEHGQPNGADEKNFANYLGTIARNGLAAPLNYKNWKKVPEIVKEDMWTMVRGKFVVEEISKDWTLSSFGHK